MRLHILSDIHLEFAAFEIPQTDADAVVLAGDIGKGLQGIELANRCGKHVVYVAGNHEYYGNALPKLTDKMRAAAGPNVAFLENDEVVIGGLRFLGTTLWTDFQLFGEAQTDYCKVVAAERMNDFRKIRCSPRYNRLSPQATVVMHRQARHWLRRSLDRHHAGPTVVVTHHAPSMRSCQSQHSEDPVAAAFASDVEELMGSAKVSLWIHGHTHYGVDYDVHGTRVVSNQRGYPGEPTAFDSTFVVDISDAIP